MSRMNEWIRLARRADPLVALDAKLRLAQSAGIGVDLDPDEAALFWDISGSFIRDLCRNLADPSCHPKPEPSPLGRFVYFIRADSGGPIKIGGSRNPMRRLAGMASASPKDLQILATSNCFDEWKLHAFYARERLRGEWFEASPRLLAFIEILAR